MARIAVLSNQTYSLFNFRGDLIRDWVAKGHEIHTCAPEKGFERQVNDLGASFTPVRLARTGMNPLKDLLYFYDLLVFLKRVRPDIVLSYTIKPVIYGSIAAYLCTIPKSYSMITGVGYAFDGEGEVPFRRALYALCRYALSKNSGVIFQNQDDKSLFERLGLLKEVKGVHIVNGSGINLDRFFYSEPKITPVRFLLMGRLIPEKGVYEYVQAARRIKEKYGNSAVFYLLGPFEDRPGAVKSEEVKAWEEEGIIEYLGQKEDVRPILNETSVYVLPSYREGTPRSTLEALSVGRPVITTDTPGCRETVRHEKTGYLIPLKDSDTLSDAMEKFIKDPSLIKKMGSASRTFAEVKFDVRKINQHITKILGC